ncbi:OmpA family protein [Hymenobacter sp. BT559]|uniref:OmpA family protein n=1 Tax=Hymenobacter sp. BT559 TaxID=2795729 RepID=UPI0018ECA4D5|nr:OmpA family protein [Hymenobacter sp. BT559]MBJ6144660.1 PD40 domain-containing protein [Hymenobacter sp. BT559]
MLPKFLFSASLLVGLATAPALAQVPASITDNKARGLYEKAQQLLQRDRQPQQALAVWQQLTDKYPDYGEPYLRKASLLLTLGDHPRALEAYQAGLSKLPVEPARAADYFVMGRLAGEVGDYAAVRTAFTNYLKTNPTNKTQVETAKLQLQNCDFAAEAMAHPTGPPPERLAAPLNQFRNQYFPVLTADNRFLVFTVRRNPEKQGQENEDLLISAVDANGKFGAPQSISPVINSPENEGAATISGDGKTLVFTSCGRAGGLGNCDLYISHRRGNQWTAPRNLGVLVNSKAWDSQPSLSADGRTLYFSSNRGGGVGGYDIYVTTIGADGNWGAARNLGAPINTTRDDLAPFIHASGTTLYYSTNGRVGLGSSDIFRAYLDEKGQWSEPLNVGYPLNTFANEASLFISSDNKRAYYTRTERPQSGDAPGLPPAILLYGSEVPASARARETSTYTQGRVFDAVTKKPIEAVVQLFDLNTNALTQQVYSDGETGEYTAVLNEGRAYAMYAAAPGYLLKSLSFDYSNQQKFDPLTLDIYLDPAKSGRSAVLNNLFFDSNKATLKPRSRTELSRLVEFLRQDPSLRVEVAGYTDNVGTPAANLSLSQRRAQAVLDYLTSQGVPASRLRAKGYGETRPLAANDTETHRAQNRRIELRIL